MDTELATEQAYIDRAYRLLAWMRHRAEELVAGTDRNDLDLLHALRRRAASLTDGGRPLCFGRIDTTEGIAFHIGRRHVEDERGDPVLIEWRAPVAVPFYRANPRDSMGLTRRRQFVVEGHRLHSMADDLFGPGHGGEVPRLRGGDALLAELERSRGGEMLDIVATIQAEQDEIIRAPLAGVLVAQGGPGSGKTAVGLHRAAFLLYGDEDLSRQGVLVLGPNRVFLRYIAQVLPALGEEAVVQTTVSDLVAGVRVVAEDEPTSERVKGDARMAQVLARALVQMRRELRVDLTVPVGLRTMTVSARDCNELARGIGQRRITYEDGRSILRDALVAAVVARHPDAGTEGEAEVARAVRAHRGLAKALDRLWPAASPTALVRLLLSNRNALARAAEGILSASEQRAVRLPPTPTQSLDVGQGGPRPAWELRHQPTRKPSRREPWTAADVALIDEASALIAGRGRTYGHVVVDEAQDLSPMQLRMVGRRAPSGSITFLGDLAQASGAWSPDRWDDVVAHVAAPDGWRLEELTLGYRSPADVLELASRVQAIAAPEVPVMEAVRAPGGRVNVIVGEGRQAHDRRGPQPALDASHAAELAASEAAQLASRWSSTAVLVARADVEPVRAALQASGLDVGDASSARLDRRVTLLAAAEAKGLEFDAVVVVEPAAIVADAPRGLRLLYVALTRPTQALSVVITSPLDGQLAGLFGAVPQTAANE